MFIQAECVRVRELLFKVVTAVQTPPVSQSQSVCFYSVFAVVAVLSKVGHSAIKSIFLLVVVQRWTL